MAAGPIVITRRAYRVGPLARLNVCDLAGTPRADAELREFRRLAPRGQAVSNSFHYHFARLIEIQFAIERIAETLDDPVITRQERPRPRRASTIGVTASASARRRAARSSMIIRWMPTVS